LHPRNLAPPDINTAARLTYSFQSGDYRFSVPALTNILEIDPQGILRFILNRHLFEPIDKPFLNEDFS
jgi:hypothetical protein